MRKILTVLAFPAFVYAISLDEAIHEAVKNNLQIKQAIYDIKIANFQLQEDKNLWLPQFFADFSYTVLKDTPYTKIPPTPPLPAFEFKQFNKDFYQFDIGLNYPVFTGFQRIYKIKISKLDIQNQTLSQKEKIEDITHKVKIAYVDVLQAKEVLEIYQSQKRAINLHLKQAREYLKEGLTTKVDLLEAKVRLKKVEADIKKAKTNLKLAKSKLNLILNKPLDEDFKVEKINLNLENKNFDLQKLYNIALKNKNILKILSTKKKQLDYLSKIEKANFYPKVYAQAKYTYTEQYPYLDPKGNVAFTVLASLQFQGIKPYHSYLKTKLQKKKLDLKLAEVKKKVKLNVKNAYEKFLVAQENLRTYKEALKEAEEYYSLVKQQYENQLTDMTHLLDAESYSTNAKKQLQIAKYRLIKAYFDLENAVGGNLENE